MQNIKTFLAMYKQLLHILDREQKKKGIVLIFLLITVSILEMLGISAVIPFIVSMLEPEILIQNKYVAWVMDVLKLYDYHNLLLLIAFGIIGIYAMKNALILLANYYQANYRNTLEKQLSVKMLSSYMKQPYTFFLDTNSADILRGITDDIASVAAVLDSYSGLFAEGLTCLLIGVFLVSLNPFMAFSLIGIAGITALIIVIGFKKKAGECGRKTREAFSERYQCAYQTISGIKEITVMQRRDCFLKQYEEASEKAAKYNTQYLCVGKAPSRLIETIFVGSMLILVCINVKDSNVSANYVSSLGSMAIAALRILPSVSNLTNYMNALVFHRIALNEAYQNIIEAERLDNYIEALKMSNKENGEESTDKFQHEILLENIKWRYKEELPWVINGLSLRIRKGESVAFIGESGAGKTTLADIILGLLEPQGGEVKSDQHDIFKMLPQWARVIGYVPQSVYLLDDTIRCNVAFGLSPNEIDDDLVWQALEQAQLKPMVKGLKMGLDTVVGERGIRFSGGQRQRIAIARALYYNPDIIVLDEATSALDSETESAVMESIEALQGMKTLIIVAHRLTTIKKCDRIYEIKNGKAYLVDKEEIL